MNRTGLGTSGLEHAKGGDQQEDPNDCLIEMGRKCQASPDEGRGNRRHRKGPKQLPPEASGTIELHRSDAGDQDVEREGGRAHDGGGDTEERQDRKEP